MLLFLNSRRGLDKDVFAGVDDRISTYRKPRMAKRGTKVDLLAARRLTKDKQNEVRACN